MEYHYNTDMNESTKDIYVGYIPQYLTEDDLLEIIRPLGTAHAINIKRNQVDGKSLGYGFIRMSTYEESLIVIDHLCKTVIDGHAIAARWATRRNVTMIDPLSAMTSPLSSYDSYDHSSYNSSRVSSALPSPHHQSQHTNSIFVYFRFQKNKGKVTKEVLQTLCSEFGKVVNVRIKSSYSDDEHLTCGYGFVHYDTTIDGIHAATNCIEKYHRKSIKNVFYKFEPSINLFQFTEHLIKISDNFDQISNLRNLHSRLEVYRYTRDSGNTTATNSPSNMNLTSPMVGMGVNMNISPTISPTWGMAPPQVFYYPYPPAPFLLSPPPHPAYHY